MTLVMIGRYVLNLFCQVNRHTEPNSFNLAVNSINSNAGNINDKKYLVEYIKRHKNHFNFALWHLKAPGLIQPT